MIICIRVCRNQAILEYLLSNPDKYAKTIESMKEECQMENVTNSGKAILEKKWVSVIRLQKKVMELEAKLANSSEKPFNNGNSSNSSKSKNFPRGPPKANMQGHREPITCVGIHPTYSICASGSEDASIRIWDYDSGSFERTLKGHIGPVTGVCFEPTSGKILASCSTDMTAKLWDTNNNYVCINTLRGHDHSISDVKFNLPISDTILTCSRDQTIRYWDTSSGYCQKTLANGHSEWIRCISVSLDGAWVASGSSDHTIAIWNNVNGQLVHVSISMCLHVQIIVMNMFYCICIVCRSW